MAAEKILGGGGLHPTYGRFCRNKGRFHKLLGENDLARKYLDNFYHNSVSLYGQKHPETLRALQLLQELTEVEEKAWRFETRRHYFIQSLIFKFSKFNFQILFEVYFVFNPPI